MKSYIVYIIAITVTSAAIPKDFCETCLPPEKCPLLNNMSTKEQQSWIEKFSCTTPQKNDGVSAELTVTAKRDYVCCSNNVWGVEKTEQYEPSTSNEFSSKLIQATRLANDRNNDPYSNDWGDRTTTSNYYQDFPNDYIERSSVSRRYEWHPNPTRNYDDKIYRPNNNQPQYQGIRNAGASYQNRWTNNRNTHWNERPGRNQWSFENPNNRGRENENTNRNTQPPFRSNTPRLPNNSNNNRRIGSNENNFGNNNPYPRPDAVSSNNNKNKTRNLLTGQCARLTSFPPDPQSECCGREASDDDRITGGKATELYQYPWTVFLLTTFDYGYQLTGFNCGGSLLSAKYVLSAGHCVYDKEAIVKSVELNLAEYDKRTFPRDCKTTKNGRKCIENKVMYAENIAVHPQYDDQNLLNDISLIRLRGTAPYTDYIRPICLPTIDIDKPMFTNLQFEVAGWGRIGQFTSNVKQSTVVRLVNRDECKRFYPQLTHKHLCAAGRSGEDTCKGDSGGPLMILYRGRSYVAGVVSGKRADTPCGTANVPSLYTNVYHYLDWIRDNIKN